jgi:hypothetical protein
MLYGGAAKLQQLGKPVSGRDTCQGLPDSFGGDVCVIRVNLLLSSSFLQMETLDSTEASVTTFHITDCHIQKTTAKMFKSEKPHIVYIVRVQLTESIKLI